MFLPTGQKFRFKGRNGIAKARACAEELQGACIRSGSEIEMTADREMHFTNVAGGNGFHLTPLAEHKIERTHAVNHLHLRSVDFR